MPKIIISDTSSLIIFQNIGELEILKKLYSEIIVTPQIVEEFKDKLPSWIVTTTVKDIKYLNLLATQVDLGEASAIALSQEVEDSLILLDDLKARKLAKKLKINFTGALGVIHKAKQEGVIKKVRPLIDKLLATNFRISEKIIDELLRINEEL